MRDTIVVGASAGGVEALKRLLSVFPADLRASIFVTLHLSVDSALSLADILGRSTPLNVIFAKSGMPTSHGCVYLASPDRHLVLADGHVSLVLGPRENRCRPAVDPLFRSAAVHRRSRVIGAVLSGLLDDGAEGLLAVKRCGGLAFVQSPDDALEPSMPRHAAELLGASLDGAHPIEELGRRIVHAVGEHPPSPPPVPPELSLEEAMLADTDTSTDRLGELGNLVAMTCPDCGGSLSLVGHAAHERYRCFTGHAFTARALLSGQSERVERALWAAMRSMEERGNTLRALAARSRASGHGRSAATLEEEAGDMRAHASTLREVLLQQRRTRTA